jgi:hypothetical protein
VKPEAYTILQGIEESYYKIAISGMLMLSKLLIIRLQARAVRYLKLYIVEETETKQGIKTKFTVDCDNFQKHMLKSFLFLLGRLSSKEQLSNGDLSVNNCHVFVYVIFMLRYIYHFHLSCKYP